MCSSCAVASCLYSLFDMLSLSLPLPCRGLMPGLTFSNELISRDEVSRSVLMQCSVIQLWQGAVACNFGLVTSFKDKPHFPVAGWSLSS